jgi:hypothetical protein
MILTGNMFVDILLHFMILIIYITFIRYAVFVPIKLFIFSCFIAAVLITTLSNIFFPSFTLNNILKAIEFAKAGPKPDCPTPCPTPEPKPCPTPPKPKPCNSCPCN